MSDCGVTIGTVDSENTCPRCSRKCDSLESVFRFRKEDCYRGNYNGNKSKLHV